MDWTYLGHAGWLAHAAGLRLLVDPLLEDPHHGGTYEVWPPRRLVAEQLRPDFVLVSHAHPDHFDVRSLRRLAQLDAESVLVTPDPFVAEIGARLGFSTTHVVAPGSRVELDRVSLVLTPSLAEEPECGFLVETEDGAVWDQVDTVLSDDEEVRRVVGASQLSSGRVALALVRWQPLLEIEAQVPGSLAFPLALYDGILSGIAAIGASVVVPAAAGQRHVGGARWLDAIGRPVSEERFLRDVVQRAPGLRALPSRVGGTYRLRGGATELDDAGGAGLVQGVHPCEDPRAFRGLEVPAVVDPSPPSREPALEAALLPWIRGPLREALGAAWHRFLMPDEARLGLEIVFPSGPRGFSLCAGPGGCALSPGLVDDLDVLDVVSATALADVLAGRRGWGDVLLAGELRASLRAYRVGPAGARPCALASTFLYYALPYAESMRRATLAQVDAVLQGRPMPWEASLQLQR